MTARIRPWRVYVASPYTAGDTAANVGRAIDAADRLLAQGFAPYCPLLNHFWHIYHPHGYQTWLDLDLAFLPICDVLVRLPGDSPGADVETVRAVELGIPVVHLNDLSPIEDQLAEVLR
jgi:hypothetical protein